MLVLGSKGMLGHCVLKMLSDMQGWQVHGTQSRDRSAPHYLNALDPIESWQPLVSNYHYIVNCIGVLKTDIVETDRDSAERALRVNGHFPNLLAQAANQSRIIHVSTDGVFSGRSNKPYQESDPLDCTDVYGKTKAVGECQASNFLSVRCSLVGRDPEKHRGLIEKVLTAPEGSEIPGFDDQHWSGVTTQQFAALCRAMLAGHGFEQVRSVGPVHHFSPNPVTTKYELLLTTAQVSGRDVRIRRTQAGSGAASRVITSSFRALNRFYVGVAAWKELIQDAIAEDPVVPGPLPAEIRN